MKLQLTNRRNGNRTSNITFPWFCSFTIVFAACWVTVTTAFLSTSSTFLFKPRPTPFQPSSSLLKQTEQQQHVSWLCAEDVTASTTSGGLSSVQEEEQEAQPPPQQNEKDLSTTTAVLMVALTREEGKNDKFRDELLSHERLTAATAAATTISTATPPPPKIVIKEMPCIEHADGEDYPQLHETLENGNFDYVAVTSPEAARVLASAWRMQQSNEEDDKMSSTSSTNVAKRPAVAAVGKATQEALEELGIDVSYCPSKATAETLAMELPLITDKVKMGLPTTILYPASCKAKSTLEQGLAKRGFAVTRLNTYDTITAQWSETQRLDAILVQIVCFASPSAVKGWLLNTDQNRNVLAACIGETSAQACRENGWPESQIFYPDKPGLSGWADAVADAVNSINETTKLN